MSRARPLMIALVLLGVAGCQTARCPMCLKPMPEGQYCDACNAVSAEPATVFCPKCRKERVVGAYCRKCNRFVFAEEVACECGAVATKGTYCPRCKAYAGVPEAAYCPTCRLPYPRALGACPRCKGKTGPARP